MFGELIKREREAKGLSLKTLGKACGISDSEMLKIENGERKTPNWRTLCKLADQLELHPVELLYAAGYINEKYVEPYNKIHKLEKLDDSGLQTIQLFVDFLISRKGSKNASVKEKLLLCHID
jgi:transcriptional regulator with XRE-family HTH domain